MYRSLGALAAAAMLAAIVVPGPAAAAEQREGPGIHKQVSGEEFSAQRRRYVARRHFAPRRYAYRSYRPGFYRPYPYAAYGYPYRRYYSPGPFIGIGPFGFGFGRW
jgi:hypothetical protein